MKKIKIFLILFLLLIITGCNNLSNKEVKLEYEEKFVTLNVNDTYKLNPKVKQNVDKISYQIQNPRVIKVSDDGVVTALDTGEAYLYIIYNDDMMEMIRIFFSVVTIGLDIIDDNVYLYKDQTIKLNVSLKNIEENQLIVSSNSDIIECNGLNVKAKEFGNAVITVKYDNLSDTINVFVVTPTINITNKLELKKDIEYQLNITLTPKLQDSDINLQYSSSNEKIAKVNINGLIQTIDYGTVTISVQIQNVISSKKDITLTVIKGAKDLIVTSINVGQGDCTLIELPNGENMMIDAGKGLDENTDWCLDNIKKVLKEKNITKIDHLIITHNHSDHYYYVPEIVQNYKVTNVYINGSTREINQYIYIMGEVNRYAENVYTVEIGDKIIDEDNLTLQVIFTRKEINEASSNVNSVVVRLQYYSRSFLFTGDIGFNGSKDGEFLMLDGDLSVDSDVLKVGHHGSAYSSSDQFIKAVSPTYAYITTASYSSTGHPHQRALDTLKKYNVTIYQSKDNGNITFTTDGNIIQVKTEK